MKRFFFFAALCVSAMALASCEFDDSDLWQKVDEMQQQIDTNAEDIATLTALVDAMNNGKVITNVEKTEEGYTLTFSDGSTISLRNGEDGEKGEKVTKETRATKATKATRVTMVQAVTPFLRASRRPTPKLSLLSPMVA